MQLEFNLKEKQEESATSEATEISPQIESKSNVYYLEDRRRAKAYAELLAHAEASVKW